MKRPLLVVAVGYIIGIVWGLYCNCSIALLYAIFIISCILFKLIYKSKKQFKMLSLKRYFRYVKIVLKFHIIVTVIISSLISNIIVIKQNNKHNNLYANVSNVTLTGVVVSNAKQKEYKNVYKVKVETLNSNRKFKNTYLWLNVKNAMNVKIDYGDKIKVVGDFVQPEVQRNYGGFNYKEFLKTQKVYGTVKTEKIEITDKDGIHPIFILSNKVFLQIKNKIENTFTENTSQLILGIMLGYTEKLDEDIKQSFRDSNIAHILAVSGMHISYIIMGVMLALKKHCGKVKSRVITILVLIAYMFITGFAPSVVRAGIMGIIMLGAGILHRKSDVWTSIALSILVILIYNPFLLNSLSVLLSYGGTIGIIVFNNQINHILEKIKIKDKRYKYRINKKAIKYLKEMLSVAISAQVVIMPIMAMNFNTVGIAFCFTNVLLGIIIGPIVMLGGIAILISFVSVGLLKIISYMLSPLLQALVWISYIGNQIPFNKIYIATPSCLHITIYYIIVFSFNFIYKVYLAKNPTAFQFRVRNLISLFKYKFRQNKNKFISSILIICLVVSVIQIIPQDLKIYFIDVGQR